ncbi:tyrosine-type recombinase/integrase [Butyrivibrio sp. AE3006]|uniref:tyrosine-type recombinase/integrase n=1 Tax=Butyrivibrio sp. AE3006 TaxID=1280673 RepID=UPI00056729CF|nr:tyrosine-type recombinase/integrase [Butyrivibrio sp. AE3006]
MDEISHFITELKLEGRMSENTVRSYQTDLKKFEWYLQDNGLVDILLINEKQLKEYVDSISKQGYSAATLARNIVSLKAFFKTQAKQGRMPYDISENLTAPKVELPKTVILTRKQIELLLSIPDSKSPKGQRDSAMLELMYATGIKVSELIKAKVSDLDMQVGSIECKSDKKDRIIPFDKRTRKALVRYLQDGRRHLIKSNLEELLFVNYQGEPMSRQGVWKIVKRYADYAEIDAQITPESLRHSFAAHLVERGADVDAVQEMLGHVTAASTNRYVKENKNYIRDVYNQTH